MQTTVKPPFSPDVSIMSTNPSLQALIDKYRYHPDFADLDMTDINQQCYPDDDTLLHLVARVGGADEIALLVASGANVNASGDIGYTPLHSAASMGRLKVVEKLLELGASLNLQDEFGDTPLTVAQTEGHAEVVRLLKRADKNLKLSVRASTNT